MSKMFIEQRVIIKNYTFIVTFAINIHMGKLTCKNEYFQVCYCLNDESVIEREFSHFEAIDDNYPKYVLSMDELDFLENGIIHKNIIDWLLSLD